MSTLEGAMGETAASDPAPVASAYATWWARVESWLMRAGEHLNPILVKETRQAFKSKQFTITFGLLLLAGWLYSLGGVLMVGQGIYYGAHGPEMFIGYYVILAIPLLVVVPFTAFRSLASEREDGTYELLSITSLSSRQVVSGKLGSAAIQMVLYASAILPCLAFTYLLRGVELPSMLTVIAYTFLGSLGLSLIGLFFATLTGERHWQVVLSVMLICGLLSCCWLFVGSAYAVVYEEAIDFRDYQFWIAAAIILSVYVCASVSIFLASCAQINFASSNRSTALRLAALGHCAVFIAWMSYLWIYPLKGNCNLLMVTMALAGAYWFAMGALMTGEESELSLRVRRQLPQSFLGRVFLTWLSPGPGTGYVLAVSSLMAIGLVVLAALLITDKMPPSNWQAAGPLYEREVEFTILAWSYVTLFLGIGRGLIGAARRVSKISPHTTLLIHVLLLVMGIAFPMLLEFFFGSFQSRFEYSILHASNPMWTMINVVEGRGSMGDMAIVQFLVPFAALIVLLLNFPSIAEEVRRIRIAAPKRVAEEDAQEAALRRPAQVTKTNPWD